MKPKYQIIAEALRLDIAAGVFKDGQTLRTEEELKQRFSVSRQTIRQAITLLENDGLVVRRRGSGTYVTHGPRKQNGARHVGVITTYITDYIFPSIVRGIESVLSNEDCIMSLSATYNHTSRERALIQRFLETSVDGLIIEGTRTAMPNPNISLYEELWAHNIPYVFINGYYPQLPRNIHVVTDDEGGGRQAADYLFAKGHTRIGGIFKSDDMQGHLRFQGFSAALRDRGLPLQDKDVCWFTTENKKPFLSSEPGITFLERLPGAIDAIVCYNDEIALILMEHLQCKGLSIPGDLSIISFDNSPFASICNPRLTSLSHPKDAFGRAAATKLMNMMRGTSEASAILPWELIERESVCQSYVSNNLNQV